MDRELGVLHGHQDDNLEQVPGAVGSDALVIEDAGDESGR